MIYLSQGRTELSLVSDYKTVRPGMSAAKLLKSLRKLLAARLHMGLQGRPGPVDRILAAAEGNHGYFIEIPGLCFY